MSENFRAILNIIDINPRSNKMKIRKTTPCDIEAAAKIYEKSLVSLILRSSLKLW